MKIQTQGQSRCLPEQPWGFLLGLIKDGASAQPFIQTHLEAPLLILVLRKHGVMIMETDVAQRPWALIKGFTVLIKDRQEEQEMFESAYCRSWPYVTQG